MTRSTVSTESARRNRGAQEVPVSDKSPTHRAPVCRDGNCIVLPRPGQEYCPAHIQIRAEAEGAARRHLSGRKRPLKARPGDPHVTDWLPLNRED